MVSSVGCASSAAPALFRWIRPAHPGVCTRRTPMFMVMSTPISMESGDGLCLDLGCGSGLYFDVLAATGRTVVGLDRSADQLRIAQGRSRQVVQGVAAALPFADGN